MVGSAIVHNLQSKGYTNIITRTRAELDLTDQQAVDAFFAREQPEQVYLAAAKVGGIHANNVYRAQFLYENLMMEANVIHAAWKHGVDKLCSSVPPASIPTRPAAAGGRCAVDRSARAHQ